jgi:prolyl 4-hydroxylase
MLLLQNQGGGGAAAAAGLAVQDRPGAARLYNGANPGYPGLRVLSPDPPVFLVERFLSPGECDFLILSASDGFGPAPVVGRGAGEISPSRTSSTCYLAREDVPDLVRRVSLLTGKPMGHCELPQVGRYLPTQQYQQHYDAFDLATEDGRRFAMNGGQRVATVLVYLNDVPRGGATRFPCLGLDVRPTRGSALVFFPATIDGALDRRALHAALPAVDAKFVSQIWVRQGPYSGLPSKRLAAPMGAPLTAEEVAHNDRLLLACGGYSPAAGAGGSPFLLAAAGPAAAAAVTPPFSIAMPPDPLSSSASALQLCHAQTPLLSSSAAPVVPTAGLPPLIPLVPSLLHGPLPLPLPHPHPLVAFAGSAAAATAAITGHVSTGDGNDNHSRHDHPQSTAVPQPPPWTMPASFRDWRPF